MDTNECILEIAQRSAEELRKHTKGPGERYIFSDHKNNSHGNIYTIVRVVRDVDRPQMHVEPHSHEYESLFIFKGSNPDMTGLQAEVMIGNVWHKITSPKAVRIPPNVNHTYRFIKGSGEFWNIVITPGAEYNLTVK